MLLPPPPSPSHAPPPPLRSMSWQPVAIEQGLADEQGARIGAGSSNTNHDDDV